MSDSKHIALYLASLPYGGTERVAVNLATYLYDQGYKVTIVTTYKLTDEMPLPEGITRIVTEPSDMVFNQGRIGNFRKRIANLQGVWRDLHPDVILSFIGKNNMMALLTTRRMHIPVYVAVRGAPEAEYYNRLLKLVSKTLFIRARGIILQTHQSISYFPHYLRGKCKVLKNPLNPMFLEENLGRTPEKTIVSVGRCDDNKNQQMLIDAFAKLSDKYPDYRVIIYGDGPVRQQLIDYVGKIGLSDRINLPGITGNTRESIKNAGVFVLTSDTEGMPNALIEAMTLGIPCISTDCPCGGPAEIIENGRNGLLVPVRDIDALSDALDVMLSDYDRAVAMGMQASLIKEDLNPKVVNRQWEDYLLR